MYIEGCVFALSGKPILGVVIKTREMDNKGQQHSILAHFFADGLTICHTFSLPSKATMTLSAPGALDVMHRLCVGVITVTLVIT